jgi:hypothetical protein
MVWAWSEAINGAEIVTLFTNNKTISLENFHIRKNICDSILYRIKIYSCEDGYYSRASSMAPSDRIWEPDEF